MADADWRIRAIALVAHRRRAADVLPLVLDLAASLVGADAAGVYLYDARGLRIRHRLARGYQASLAKRTIPRLKDGPLGKACLNAQPVHLEMGAWRTLDGRPSAQARVVVPLTSRRGEVLGVLDLIRDLAGGLDERSIAQLVTFGREIADHLRDLDASESGAPSVGHLPVSRESATPRRAVPNGFEMRISRSRATGRQDGLAVWPADAEQWWFLLLDVRGATDLARSVAELLPAVVRDSARASLESDGRAPLVYTLREAQRFMLSCAARHLVTMFCGVLDTTTGVLSYVNAGQHEPMLLRSHGLVERLPSVSRPLGLGAPFDGAETEVALARGDTLVLSTAAFLESTNDLDEQFGNDRVFSVLARASQTRAAHVSDDILAARRDFIRPGTRQVGSLAVITRLAAGHPRHGAALRGVGARFRRVSGTTVGALAIPAAEQARSGHEVESASEVQDEISRRELAGIRPSARSAR